MISDKHLDILTPEQLDDWLNEHQQYLANEESALTYDERNTFVYDALQRLNNRFSLKFKNRTQFWDYYFFYRDTCEHQNYNNASRQTYHACVPYYQLLLTSLPPKERFLLRLQWFLAFNDDYFLKNPTEYFAEFDVLLSEAESIFEDVTTYKYDLIKLFDLALIKSQTAKEWARCQNIIEKKYGVLEGISFVKKSKLKSITAQENNLKHFQNQLAHCQYMCRSFLSVLCELNYSTESNESETANEIKQIAENLAQAAFNSINLLIEYFTHPEYSEYATLDELLSQAYQIVQFYPEAIDQYLPVFHKFVEAKKTPIQKRDTEIRILQLQAKQALLLHNYPAAIKFGEAGYFLQYNNFESRFVVDLVEALIGHHQYEYAGQIAYQFISAFQAFPGDFYANQAYSLVNLAEKLPPEKLDATWYLAQAHYYWIIANDTNLTHQSGTPRDALTHYKNTKRIAEQHDPSHYGLLTLELFNLLLDSEYTAAESILQLAQRYWQFPDAPRTAYWIKAILYARVNLFGIESVLKDEVILSGSAWWDYELSTTLFNWVEETHFAPYAEQIIQYRKAYNIETLRYLEDFTAGKPVHWLSGNLAVYAHSINQLALCLIQRKKKNKSSAKDDYITSISLNNKALELKPNVSSYSDIFYANAQLCTFQKNTFQTSMINAAESLWHFANALDDQDYYPHLSVNTLIPYLFKDKEFGFLKIWFTRLSDWLNQHHHRLSPSYIQDTRDCQIMLLAGISYHDPEEANILLNTFVKNKLRPIFDEEVLNNPKLLINLSIIFINTKQFELAIEYLELAYNIAQSQQKTIETKRALTLLRKAKKQKIKQANKDKAINKRSWLSWFK